MRGSRENTQSRTCFLELFKVGDSLVTAEKKTGTLKLNKRAMLDLGRFNFSFTDY